MLDSKSTSPKSLMGLLGNNGKGSLAQVAKPVAFIFKKYLPCGSESISKFPLSSAKAPVTKLESRCLNKVAVA